MMELSNQIKKYREAKGLSQESLAEKIFVSRQTISNWENSRSYPDVQNLLLLGEVFDVSLDQLVKGDVEIMKQKINNHELKKWSRAMMGAMFALAIVTLPLGEIMGLWALLAMGPIIVLMLFAAIKVEVLKKQHQLQTYQEIVNFFEKKELPAEKQELSKLDKVKKLLLVIAVTGTFVFTMLLSDYLFNLIIQ